MVTQKERVYSHYTKDAALLLGKDIQLARKARKFTARDFADRVGISRITLQKVEKGDLKCELGIVLEAAVLAGVKLFDVDPCSGSFATKLESVSDKLALLPKSIRKRRKEIDDAF
ncbi:helix-turn-helix transcriptional regulator [Bdellovibrionota bacterium FG-2]